MEYTHTPHKEYKCPYCVNGVMRVVEFLDIPEYQYVFRTPMNNKWLSGMDCTPTIKCIACNGSPLVNYFGTEQQVQKYLLQKVVHWSLQNPQLRLLQPRLKN